MKNKRGFTLVELLVVGTLIGIISLITVPNIVSMFKKSNDEEYQRFLNDISLSTEAYVQQNMDKYKLYFDVFGYTYISVDKLVTSGYLKSTTYDPKNKTAIKNETNFTVKVTRNNTFYNYELLEETLIMEEPTYGNYLLDKGDYNNGDTINWAGLDWYVVKDNGSSTTLILKSNYDVGAYGNNTEFVNSTVYSKVNVDFVSANKDISNAINDGSVVSQGQNGSNNYYVRIPNLDELSSSIPNNSSTAFWTMTADGSNIYLGTISGENIDNYVTETTGTYINGYSTNLNAILATGPTTVSNKKISQSPTEASVSINLTATQVSRPTSYGQQTNITKANAEGYGCSSSNINCPSSAYCRSASRTYYTSTCTTSSFGYSTVGSWYNPNYNVTVNGVSCGSNMIYYASGGCKTFYQLTTETYDIGYRPVITVVEKK